MPTNEQRRQAAKRKLERQLERRAVRAKRRRQLTVAFTAIGVVLAIGVVALVVVLTRGGGDDNTTAAPPTTEEAPAEGAPLPAARSAALPATVDCSYPASGEASKPNTPPQSTGVSTQGVAAVKMATTQGDLGLSLDRALSPCTVNSFVSLANQQYFNDTPCHRLVTSGIYVLQCGDPTGQGTGGPGYGFGNEFPTDQYAADDAAAQAAAIYPRGTIAMANSGQPNSNGSQFFLLYKDSPLPPQYTVFGTVDEPGLAVLEKIAAGGDDGSISAGGGAPATPVTITSMTVQA
ncbi:peptidylprolyl isomerase [Rhodococcus sp. X156]|uniref:peptidylprolyl isomerase n=1 Tax=Rhodococcus sp. X156 TaxID=2499145 RepID=UPI000FDAC2D6|nr:peptidylprolyl isomerase [Rhodococcus sp. X156]